MTDNPNNAASTGLWGTAALSALRQTGNQGGCVDKVANVFFDE